MTTTHADTHEPHFRETAELLPAMICEFDELFRIVWANRAARDTFGISPHTLQNRVTPFDLVSSEDFQRVAENIRLKLAGDDPVPQEYRMRTADGSFADFLITSNRIIIDGAVVGIRSVLMNITLLKRAEEDRLRIAEERVSAASRLAEGLRRELHNGATFAGMISRSEAMQRIFSMLPNLAAAPVSVLVSGESGTGKELIARALHEVGPRAEGPFVAVNCGALPENLIESELFGHCAGAFTDAKKDKPGKFRLAHGGTLFLDEVGELPLSMQVKLLRVLQEKVIEPLGAIAPEAVDVRIVAATNRDLPALIAAGGFREDLYYRLRVIGLLLPPLRERRCDLPILIDHFISMYNARYSKAVRTVSPAALDLLLAHNYPGNIRELGHILEHAFVFCTGEQIEPGHLPAELSPAAEPSSPQQAFAQAPSLADIPSRDALERLWLRAVLDRFEGNRIAAAKHIGIHKTTFYRKLAALGMAE